MGYFKEVPSGDGGLHLPPSLTPRTIGDMVPDEVVFLDPDCLAVDGAGQLFIETDYIITPDAAFYHHDRNGIGGQVGIGHFELISEPNQGMYAGYVADARFITGDAIPVVKERYIQENADTLAPLDGIVYIDEEGDQCYASPYLARTSAFAEYLGRIVDTAYEEAIVARPDDDEEAGVEEVDEAATMHADQEPDNAPDRKQ